MPRCCCLYRGTGVLFLVLSAACSVSISLAVVYYLHGLLCTRFCQSLFFSAIRFLACWIRICLDVIVLCSCCVIPIWVFIIHYVYCSLHSEELHYLPSGRLAEFSGRWYLRFDLLFSSSLLTHSPDCGWFCVFVASIVQNVQCVEPSTKKIKVNVLVCDTGCARGKFFQDCRSEFRKTNRTFSERLHCPVLAFSCRWLSSPCSIRVSLDYKILTSSPIALPRYLSLY